MSVRCWSSSMAMVVAAGTMALGSSCGGIARTGEPGGSGSTPGSRGGDGTEQGGGVAASSGGAAGSGAGDASGGSQASGMGGAVLSVPAAEIPKCIAATFHFRFQQLEDGGCAIDAPLGATGGDNFVLVLVQGSSEDALVRVGSAGACGDRQAWYYEDRARSFRIQGCPATCQLARAASDVDVDFLILYACPPVTP